MAGMDDLVDEVRAMEPIAEAERLVQCVAGFAGALTRRVLGKLRDGWGGWDDPHNAGIICESLDKKVAVVLNNVRAGHAVPVQTLVDVGALCAFLWWQQMAKRSGAPHA